MEEITVKISQEGIHVEMDDEGKVIHKGLGYESLVDALVCDKIFDSGILPIFGKNYIGVKQFIEHGDTTILLLESSASLRNVEYVSSDRVLIKDVPYPGLIMGVICRKEESKYKIIDTKIYATRNPIFSEHDSLYRFPFGNVYTNGSICWGGVGLSKIRSIKQACNLLNLFISSAMNNDLTSGNLKNKLENLRDSGEFNYDTLTKVMTYKELISLLMNKK